MGGVDMYQLLLKAIFRCFNNSFNIKQCSVMLFFNTFDEHTLLIYLYQITLAVGIRFNQYLAKIVHSIKEWHYI